MDNFSCNVLSKITSISSSKVTFKFLFFCVCIIVVGCESKVECPICEGYKSFETSDGGRWTCSYCDQDGMMTKDKAKQILEVLNQAERQNNTNGRKQQSNKRGNCGCCNGTGEVWTSSGYVACTVCGGDGDFSIGDGDRLLYENGGSSSGNGINSSKGSGVSPHNVECSVCRGTGYCSRCQGTGVIFLTEYATNDYTTCPVCKGGKRCRSCNGTSVSHVEYR